MGANEFYHRPQTPALAADLEEASVLSPGLSPSDFNQELSGLSPGCADEGKFVFISIYFGSKAVWEA